MVVCGVPGRSDPGGVPVWVELPPEIGRPARIRVGDFRRRKVVSLSLEELLAIVDEAETLVGKRDDRASERGAP
jgi:hypothetical protein